MGSSNNVLGHTIEMLGKIGKDHQERIGPIHDLLEKITGKNGAVWLERLKKFLRNEMVVSIPSKIVGTFKNTIDYKQSIEDYLDAGQYDYIDKLITDTNFPPTIDDTGEGEKEFVLFHFPKQIWINDAINQIALEKCRAATMRELLSFGQRYPEVQKQFPIVAVGQVVQIRPYERFGCLKRNNNSQSVRLEFRDMICSGRFRFLAIRL